MARQMRALDARRPRSSTASRYALDRHLRVDDDASCRPGASRPGRAAAAGRRRRARSPACGSRSSRASRRARRRASAAPRPSGRGRAGRGARSRGCPSPCAASPAPRRPRGAARRSRSPRAARLSSSCFACASNLVSVSLIGASFASVELEQRGLALRERVAGDRLDAVLPAGLRLLDERELLGRRPALVGEPAARPEVDRAAAERGARSGERCTLPWTDKR